MRARVAAVLIACLLFAPVLARAQNATPSASPVAADPPGCEGLSAYRAQMFAAARALYALLDSQGIGVARDQATYSSNDWALYAKAAADYQKTLQSITPPPFAKKWHEARIAHDVLLAEMGQAAVTGGYAATEAFTPKLTESYSNVLIGIVIGTKTCFAFVQFTDDYQSLSGINSEGTPVATPES